MTKKIDDLDELVLRLFIRSVKAHGLYVRFRLSMCGESRDKDIYHMLCKRANQNEYRNLMNKLHHVSDSLRNVTGIKGIKDRLRRETSTEQVEVGNTSKFQWTVMTKVNFLIRNCIEYTMLGTENMTKLEKLGQMLFNDVMTGILGNEYTDLMTEENMLQMIPPNGRMPGRGQMEAMANEGALDLTELIEWWHEQERLNRANNMLDGALPEPRALGTLMTDNDDQEVADDDEYDDDDDEWVYDDDDEYDDDDDEYDDDEYDDDDDEYDDDEYDDDDDESVFYHGPVFDEDDDL